MALTELWFWLAAAGMTLGALPPAWRLLTERRNRSYYAVLAAITAIAAVAYVAMGLDVGRVGSGDAAVYLPRYIDWLLTTPLLVLYLGLLCRPERRVYAALLGADVVIIGAGIVGALTAGVVRWVAFAVGVVAYLVLLYQLLLVLPQQATLAADRVAAVFTKLRNLTVVLWSIYPVAWVLSPLGAGLLDQGSTVLIIAYLDMISKVGFVIVAMNGRDALDALARGVAGAVPADD
jgi:sensory rhodopsin